MSKMFPKCCVKKLIKYLFIMSSPLLKNMVNIYIHIYDNVMSTLNLINQAANLYKLMLCSQTLLKPKHLDFKF